MSGLNGPRSIPRSTAVEDSRFIASVSKSSNEDLPEAILYVTTAGPPEMRLIIIQPSLVSSIQPSLIAFFENLVSRQDEGQVLKLICGDGGWTN